MSLARILAFTAVAAATSTFVTACSGGTVNVGATQEQELKKKSDGGASGNGQTCSFDDTATYSVGQSFKSPDGCNDCTCTKDGIMCTLRACGPDDGGGACTEEAKQCPDGSYVSRTGPSCEFAPCPGTTCPALGCFPQCANGVKKDVNGCDTCQCNEAVACPADAKQCPDGSYVSRTGPNCEFAPCP